MKRVAIRAQRTLDSRVYICQTCQLSTSQGPPYFQQQYPSVAVCQYGSVLSAQLRPKRVSKPPFQSRTRIVRGISSTTNALDDPESMLEEVLQKSRSITESSTIPPEESVLQLLRRCRDVVRVVLSDNYQSNPHAIKEEDSATSSLLDLDQEETSRAITTLRSSAQQVSKKSF